MALSEYITPELTFILRANSKDDALKEITSAICRRVPHLDYDEALAAVIEREQSVSSRITENVALPHALLPSFYDQVVAVGYSHTGITWDSPTGGKVHLIVLSLYGESFTDNHLQMLAELARTIRAPNLLENISRAESSEQIYDILREPAEKKAQYLDSRRRRNIEGLFDHACSFVDESKASALMVLAEDEFAINLVTERGEKTPVILVTEDSSEEVPDLKLGTTLSVPFHGIRRDDRVKLSVLFALSHGLIDKGDTLVCLSGDPRIPGLNTMEIVDVSKEFNILLSLRSALAAGGITSHVLDRALQIATSLAREGREGRPVGAIFVLGDYENVRKRCHQLVINPFRGYPEDERNILDPGLEETIKEFSRIDGAYLIRGDGVIMSMGSYIHTEDISDAHEPGLGARHAAALAITKSTQAFSIVISESTQRISLYRKGRLVMALGQAT